MNKIFIFLATGLISVQSFGWGQTGHRVIGKIAESHLSRKARKQIERILGTETIAMASTFMDEIRSDTAFDYMETWHYCTIPDGMTYEQAGTPEEGDAILAIRTIIKELKTGRFSYGDEAFNLKLLIHLAGDIHQPLHVGNGTDRGGNSVRVDYFRRKTNLHSVWDSGMIEGTNLSYTEYARWIDHPSGQEISAWQASPVIEWAYESMSYRDGIYDIPENNRLSYRYDFEHIDLVNLRLLQAGIRLAGLLNQIYG